MPYETALTLLPTIPAIRGPDAPWERETQWRGARTAARLRDGCATAEAAHEDWVATRQ